MRDTQLCMMAALIVAAYAIYMTVGPGGDGLIFASVVGAIAALAGVKFERIRIREELRKGD